MSHLNALALLLFIPLASQADVSPLDFELANNNSFVRLSYLPAQPTLVNFWRSDCPPCVHEMPLLAEAARSGRVRLITIAVQRPSDTLAAPEAVKQALRPPTQQLYAPAEPRGLLSRFGNAFGVLPHTVMLDSGRRVCAMHSGEVNQAWLDVALAACGVTSGR